MGERRSGGRTGADGRAPPTCLLVLDVPPESVDHRAASPEFPDHGKHPSTEGQVGCARGDVLELSAVLLPPDFVVLESTPEPQPSALLLQVRVSLKQLAAWRSKATAVGVRLSALLRQAMAHTGSWPNGGRR